MRVWLGQEVGMLKAPMRDIVLVLAMIATAGFVLAVHSSVRWGVPWDLG